MPARWKRALGAFYCLLNITLDLRAKLIWRSLYRSNRTQMARHLSEERSWVSVVRRTDSSAQTRCTHREQEGREERSRGWHGAGWRGGVDCIGRIKSAGEPAWKVKRWTRRGDRWGIMKSMGDRCTAYSARARTHTLITISLLRAKEERK